MTEKTDFYKKKQASHEQLPGYANWLRTEQHKGVANLAWYISLIIKMKNAGITDEEFATCTDVDQLLIRYFQVNSIWEVGTSRRRTYLRNIIRMYRIYLNKCQMHSDAAKTEEKTPQKNRT